jgi:hypothetical protein
MVTKEYIEELWSKYQDFKSTAEQYMFPFIFKYDMLLEPKYNDLQENWSDEHAEIFVKALYIVFNNLGIE